MINDKLEHKYAARSIGEVEADGTFCGHASLFDEPDLGGDTVERGAFSAAIARRGAAGIRMLYQHDPAEPIGRWLEIREDERGLFVRGRLAQSVARAREVLELMRCGALDGLSIGFSTVRAHTEPGTGLRRIREADLWEISIVTFPMLPGARVESVKAGPGIGALPTRREIERSLRRDAGLTRNEARRLVARGYASLERGRDAAKCEGLPEIIRRAATVFNHGKPQSCR
jgi:HK97 family phage prohead protease